MRSYLPNNRHIILDLVLQYDTTKKEIGKAGFFTETQRLSINQERAKIMSGNHSFKQNEALETQIALVISKIRSDSWIPEKAIQYQ
ncbi:hypothetical protein NJT12_20740 [Flavobacterium sp. AC]|uniref:Uncharacterized protein n=1 Tax=Flavobacterium azizsancarii TaxID=2961580 RepID=A0ABT4WHV5_9FLAO|nr:hypothetical protein [Flavobacterium azizsancarii]MDA6072057.1 hypothetical protein [Flavobacterium azizsancarii]